MNMWYFHWLFFYWDFLCGVSIFQHLLVFSSNSIFISLWQVEQCSMIYFDVLLCVLAVVWVFVFSKVHLFVWLVYFLENSIVESFDVFVVGGVVTVVAHYECGGSEVKSNQIKPIDILDGPCIYSLFAWLYW